MEDLNGRSRQQCQLCPVQVKTMYSRPQKCQLCLSTQDPPSLPAPDKARPTPTWPAGLVEAAVKVINSHNAGDARGRDEEKQERRDKEEQARLRRALWAAEESARHSEVQFESLRGAHRASEMQSNVELQRVYELGAHRGQSEAHETIMRSKHSRSKSKKL